MNRRKGPPRPIGDVVRRVLDDLGHGSASALARLLGSWEAAVGPEIARHARPAALRGRVLEVTVDSSAWCQQLGLRRPELLAGLARELGEEAPREIWLRVGPAD